MNGREIKNDRDAYEKKGGKSKRAREKENRVNEREAVRSEKESKMKAEYRANRASMYRFDKNWNFPFYIGRLDANRNTDNEAYGFNALPLDPKAKSRSLFYFSAHTCALLTFDVDY